jgi:hypothetical protein
MGSLTPKSKLIDEWLEAINRPTKDNQIVLTSQSSTEKSQNK